MLLFFRLLTSIRSSFQQQKFHFSHHWSSPHPRTKCFAKVLRFLHRVNIEEALKIFVLAGHCSAVSHPSPWSLVNLLILCEIRGIRTCAKDGKLGPNSSLPSPFPSPPEGFAKKWTVGPHHVPLHSSPSQPKATSSPFLTTLRSRSGTAIKTTFMNLGWEWGMRCGVGN